jgi:hypothetical protein
VALKSFKAYDIRGRLPDELNEDLAERIGRAYAQVIGRGTVMVGYDIRQASPALATALSEGCNRAGCDVIDIGLCGTEEVYFQTFARGVQGGIMVTASHNPIDYNSMKLVREGARPVSGDSGLRDCWANVFAAPTSRCATCSSNASRRIRAAARSISGWKTPRSQSNMYWRVSRIARQPSIIPTASAPTSVADASTCACPTLSRSCV